MRQLIRCVTSLCGVGPPKRVGSTTMREVWLTVMLMGGSTVAGELAAQRIGTVRIGTEKTAVAFAIEGRGMLAVPTGKWNFEDDLDEGFGLGGNVQIHFGAWAAYAGWERFSFALRHEDDKFFSEDVSGYADDRGVSAGVIGFLPLDMYSPPGTPFVLFGVIQKTTTVAFGDNTGLGSFESAPMLGYEAGAGLVVPVGSFASFSPAVRYRRHRTHFDEAQEVVDEFADDMFVASYLTVDVGIRIVPKRASSQGREGMR